MDEAIRRRLNLVPFTVTIPPAERDTGLPEKLKAEWSGILQWVIERMPGMAGQGPGTPCGRSRRHRQLSAGRGRHIQLDQGTLQADRYGGTQSSRLYSDWCIWSKAAGEDPGSQKRFSQALEDKGYVKTRRRGTPRSSGSHSMGLRPGPSHRVTRPEDGGLQGSSGVFLFTPLHARA